MHIGFWIVFNAVILILLFLDLAVVNRGYQVVPFKRALLMSAFWIGRALALRQGSQFRSCCSPSLGVLLNLHRGHLYFRLAGSNQPLPRSILMETAYSPSVSRRRTLLASSSHSLSSLRARRIRAFTALAEICRTSAVSLVESCSTARSRKTTR